MRSYEVREMVFTEGEKQKVPAGEKIVAVLHSHEYGMSTDAGSSWRLTVLVERERVQVVEGGAR